MKRYDKKVGDVVVWVYDSPGLQDGINDKEKEREYLEDLQENCREVDLNLYCVKMNDGMRSSEVEAIITLSNAFGKDKFWQNTSMVLTFANEVKPPKSGSFTPDTFFTKRMSEWKYLLRHVLNEKAGVSEKVVNNIPIVPAGYSDEPSLPAANCDYWLSDLWFQCLYRTRSIGKPILLKLNLERLRPLEKTYNTKKKGYEQPIIPPDEKSPKRFEAYLKQLR